MKLKTLIHRRVRKFFFRLVRYSPVTERLINWRHRTTQLDLPEIRSAISVSPGDIIIDCGANVGDITSRFASTPATIHAFEPNPYVFAVLARRFAGHPRVICHNQAVWVNEDTITLSLPVGDRSSDVIDASVASTLMGGLASKRTQDVEVGCVNLSKFILGLPGKVRFMKMDIEGAEGAVLPALIETGAMARIEYMAVETHENIVPGLAEPLDQVRAYIAKNGLGERYSLGWV
jgi:FkbM family methyltransferase